jgi:hypothetical protein
MPRSLRSYLPHNKLSLAVTAITLIVLTVLAVSARSWLPAAATNEPLVSAAAPASPTTAPLEAELIVLRPSGFEPVEITRPAGEFLLTFHNRSGLEEVNLLINLESGATLREERIPLERPNWRRVVAIPPGRYVITEANHPDWVCRVTITAP